MPTRREAMIGAGSLLLGSGLLTSGAFAGGSTSPATALQVVASPRVFLIPGRDDNAHVSVEEGPEFEHVRTIEPAATNMRAVTRFEHLVEVVNNTEETIDELYFKLTVESDAVEPADIEAAISIVSASGAIPATGESNYLKIVEDPHGDVTALGAGETVGFGIELDLTAGTESSLTSFPDPDEYTASLELSTDPAT